MAYDDVEVIEIGGPGARTSGGGFRGGGFGLEGAAEGMLIASALNMLTTRTKVDTVICLRTSSAELFLHNRSEAPDALRIRLSQVFTILRERDRSRRGATERDDQDGAAEEVIDRLAKLADLLDRGHLSQAEFDSLKAAMLSRLTVSDDPK